MTKLLKDLPAARKASAEAQAKVKTENAKYTAQVGYRLWIGLDAWYPVHKQKRGRVALVKSQKDATLFAASADLLEALIAMEREKSDYMRLNHLGDPSNETTNKMARAAIAKAQGAPHE